MSTDAPSTEVDLSSEAAPAAPAAEPTQAAPVAPAAPAAGPDHQAEMVGFADGNVATSLFPKFKGEAGRTDRLAVISPTIVRKWVHYHNQKGFLCLSTPDKKGVCCETLRDPVEQKFGIVVFKYATDGSAEAEILNPAELRGRVMIWVFSETKFDLLKTKAARHPILGTPGNEPQADLIVNCTDSTFQKMDLDVVDAFYKTKPEWVELLGKQIDNGYKRIRQQWSALTEAEVRELIGISSAASRTAQDGEVDLGEILAG